jgi:hypothetical protein
MADLLDLAGVRKATGDLILGRHLGEYRVRLEVTEKAPRGALGFV